MRTAGVIGQLARYPVKSMRGEALPSTMLTLQGFQDDRRYAFVQSASRSGFPWLTARELPDLLLYRTAVEGSGTPQVAVTVTTPNGEMLRVDSTELREHLEARSGRGLFLLRDDRGSFDVAPVSLLSRQTVRRIAEETAMPEDPWRFRPNVLLDLEGGEAFEELKWVGRTLRLGPTARVAITEVDQRCMMIGLDPASGTSNPAVLRCVVQQHGQCAGVYATVLTAGEVRTGDKVEIED
jgi:uncharacterized protein